MPTPAAGAASERKKRVAIIGAGVSGLAHADVMQRCGFEAVVFERADSPGGQWLQAYAEVDTQNTAPEYCFSQVPWPFKPHLHPTGEEVLRYIEHAVKAMNVDVRLQHEVISVERAVPGPGWRVTVADHGDPQPSTGDPTTTTDHYDFVIVCVGHFCNDQMAALSFPGAETFGGRIVTDRDFKTDPRVILEGKRVAVVGFGKAALDMTMLAARNGAAGPVHHIFRSARWTLPRFIAGLSMVHFLFARMSTLMIPCWMQPTWLERFLHSRFMAPVVAGFWAMLGWVVKVSHRHDASVASADELIGSGGAGGGGGPTVYVHAHSGTSSIPEATAGVAQPAAKQQASVRVPEQDKKQAAAAGRRRLDLVISPDEPLSRGLRSAFAVAPPGFCRAVLTGRIEPHRATISRLVPGEAVLSDGSTLDLDVIVVCAGGGGTRYPFLPADLRARLEGHPDGCQLYRHVMLPGEPTLGIGCMNHSFFLIPGAETGALWLAALWRGELALPPVSEMERAVDHVRNWKRANTLFEATRLEGTNARFHQYIDGLLLELGVSPYRRLPNIFAEIFIKYVSGDYRTVVDEYLRAAARRRGPLKPLPIMT